MNGRKEVDTQSACASAPSLLYSVPTHSQASFPRSSLVDKRQARPVDARVFAPQSKLYYRHCAKPTQVISFRVLFESDIGQCKQQRQEETEIDFLFLAQYSFLFDSGLWTSCLIDSSESSVSKVKLGVVDFGQYHYYCYLCPSYQLL